MVKGFKAFNVGTLLLKSMKKIYDLINENGYYNDFKIEIKDIILIKQLIYKQLKENTSKINVEINEDIFEDYQNVIDDALHKKISIKSNRTLSENDSKTLLKLELFDFLKVNFGEFIITNEDKQRSKEIYWRIVRPNQMSDIGPLHADKWFWDQNYYNDKNYNLERLKIWIPIQNDTINHGFKFIPKSHKTINNFSVHNDGLKTRCKYIGSVSELVYHKGKPGNAIIFHDNLIHGGEFGINKCRISIEFTIALTK